MSYLGGGGGGASGIVNYYLTNYAPSGWLNVTDFFAAYGGAADATKTGGTDCTAAFQACADACNAQGKAMYVPYGPYRTDAINIGTVSVLGDGMNKTLFYLNDGEDGFVWTATPSHRFFQGFSVYMGLQTDSRTSFNRVGFDGSRVGNCAFVGPGGSWPRFDDIAVRGNDGYGTLGQEGNCGIFFTDAPYGLAGTHIMVRELSYGLICGVSDDDADLGLAGPTTDFASDTITIAGHGFSDGDLVALLWDANVADCSTITPRVAYYVVNSDTDTFQLSLTLGGAAVTITADVGWAPWACLAGDDRAEYACDEWAIRRLTLACAEASGVIVNATMGHIGELDIQSSRVSLRLLNFESITRSLGSEFFFGHVYAEGPLDATWDDNVEYYRSEWDAVFCPVGPHLRGSTSLAGLTATLAGDRCYWGSINVANDRTLNITGNNNFVHILPDAGIGNSLFTNTGSGNTILLGKDTGGGSSDYFTEYRDTQTPRHERGGWSPDFLHETPSAPYWGRGWTLLEGASMNTQGASDVAAFDDSEDGPPGYMVCPDGLTLRYHFGSNQRAFTIGKSIPATKCKIRAWIRLPGGESSVAFKVQTISPSANFMLNSTPATSGTDFQLIEGELDATGYDGYTFQVIIGGAGVIVHAKFIDFQPIASPLYGDEIDFGGGVTLTKQNVVDLLALLP